MVVRSNSSPVKVLYLRDDLRRSGGTFYILNTLKGFDPDRVAATLAISGWPREAVSEAEDPAIPPYYINCRKRNPRILLNFYAWIRRRLPDLLVLSGPRSMVLGCIVARRFGLPVSPLFTNMIASPGLKTWVHRRLMPERTIGQACSRAVRDWASELYGLRREQIEVMYPGIDLGRFGMQRTKARGEIRSSLRIPSTAPVIAVIGRLATSQKGQDIMVRAMREIRRRRPDAVLMIVGDGPDRNALERLSSELGLAEAVRLLGNRDDIPEILAASNLVVVPSVCEEGFGLVALEGSAAGRPVVAFASGGLSEAVEHERTGLLVPKRDEAGLTNAVLRLLDEPVLAGRLGEAGRQAMTRFDASKHVEDLMKLYERIAGGINTPCDRPQP